MTNFSETSLRFNASGDTVERVEIGDVAALKFDVGDAISWSVWLKTDTAFSASGALISKLGAASIYPGWEIAIDNTGRFYLQIIDDLTVPQRILVYSGAGYHQGHGWMHLVITKNATELASGVTMYINGSEPLTVANGWLTAADDTFVSGGGTSFDNTEIAMVGMRPGGGSPNTYFRGWIDDPCVWDRALTPAEARAVFNRGRPGDNRQLAGGVGARLDGVNEHALGTDVNDKLATSPFTIHARFSTTDTDGWVFVKVDNSLVRGYGLYIDASGRPKFLLGRRGVQAVEVRSDVAVNDGLPHQVDVVHSGSGTAAGVTIYIDGSSVATTTERDDLAGGFVSNNGPHVLGGRTTTEYLACTLDQAAVYGSALDADDITDIWDGGNTADLLVTGPGNPELYWKCGDGDTYPTITDHGSVGDDLTMTNTEASDFVSVNPWQAIASDIIWYATFEGDTHPTVLDRQVKAATTAAAGIFDRSGNGHDGTPVGMVDADFQQTDTPSGVGRSVVFGSSDSIDVADDAALDFNVTQTWSWSAWVKLTADTAMFTKQDGGPNGYRFETASGNLRVRLQQGATDDIAVDSNAGSLLNTGWRHVGVTCDGTNDAAMLTLYIDGQVVADTHVQNDALTDISNTAAFKFHNVAANGQRLDEVNLYSTELSAAQMLALYGQGRPPAPETLDSWASIVASWNFQAANDGTMVNMESGDLVADGAVVGGPSTLGTVSERGGEVLPALPIKPWIPAGIPVERPVGRMSSNLGQRNADPFAPLALVGVPTAIMYVANRAPFDVNPGNAPPPADFVGMGGTEFANGGVQPPNFVDRYMLPESIAIGGDPAPVIDNFLPAPASSIDLNDAITLDVSDDVAVAQVTIIATFGDGRAEIVFDGTNFLPPYLLNSVETVVGSGFSYSVERTEGWNDADISLTVTATDNVGGASSAIQSWTVSNPSPGPDVTLPVVANFLPPSGSTIEAGESVQFDVTDNSGVFTRIIVTVTIDGITEVVHDGERFRGLYAGASTRSIITNGFRYFVAKQGGWTGSPTFETFAIDARGLEAL